MVVEGRKRREQARIGSMSERGRDVPAVPASVPEPFRTALAVATEAWVAEQGGRLISIVLFGSVARGQVRPTSDIDLVIVAEGLPRSLAERRRPFLQAWERARAARGLPYVEWNLIVKSPAEARVHSPLYLDIVEEGILILDREGAMGAVLAAMRARMRALGSRRVYLADGSWYWDLKPDFRFGEVVEI
jgi:predicted nucleotidyltransferase